MRLSTFAAEIAAGYLDTGDRHLLREYSGDRFRPRLIARQWMRHAMRMLSTRPLMEAAFGMMRVPGVMKLAEHVFFARGSFPDIRYAPSMSSVRQA
jgi:hypothetical protein